MTDTTVIAVDKRDIEIDIRRAMDLMECASCAAQYIKVTGTCGIVAALVEASDTLSDVMDKLGITEPELEERD